jgi:hypothetical protein
MSGSPGAITRFRADGSARLYFINLRDTFDPEVRGLRTLNPSGGHPGHSLQVLWR